MALLSLLTKRRWVMACYFILLKQQQQSRFTHRKTTLLMVGVCKLMIVPNHSDNIENKKFTIQYTKEELDKITVDFVTQLSKYIAK